MLNNCSGRSDAVLGEKKRISFKGTDQRSYCMKVEDPGFPTGDDVSGWVQMNNTGGESEYHFTVDSGIQTLVIE